MTTPIKVQITTAEKPFAKLFDTARGQILVTTESGSGDREGPCLSIRGVVSGLGVSIVLGPWSDDDAGWDEAEQHLANFGQVDADARADGFAKMLANWAGSAA